MRDLVSCLGENAVNVSCSSYSNNASCIIPSTTTFTPSSRISVSSIYRATLSNKSQILITVTWCKSFSINQGLTITFNEGSSSLIAQPFRLNTNSRFFRKKKGSKLLESSDSYSSRRRIELFWDLSNAKYENGPEPSEGFYVAIMVDSELVLTLGDTMMIKLKTLTTPFAKSSLLARREHCSSSGNNNNNNSNTLYTTRARFCETGTWHDIMIRCCGESEGLNKSPVLVVCIDEKTVIRVKRLHWNFRGNQTVFVDGLLVDLMWDVHNWFFNNSNFSPSSGSGSGSGSGSSSGYAVFMFRTRSGLDSRLWLEEKDKMALKDDDGGDKDRGEFSLLIYASKST